MSQLDPRRFAHQVSEPDELQEGDFVEMDALKRNKDLFRLVISMAHASTCAELKTSDD
jgi:hypothetical protein